LITTLLTPAIFYFLSARDLEATYTITLICTWIFFTHKSNIQRMLSGAEDKIKSN
jgi:glycerol-3-phosphate acyltransferase PlsY